MKLSDFLKQQGDTPQGKSTYQAFIDNFDKSYEAAFFRTYETDLITSAFQWDISPEDYTFWDIIAVKWEEVTDPENDMLWLLDTKETKELDEAAKAIDTLGYYENSGDHYAKHTIQLWDIIREYELDYFEGNALKYLLRQKGNKLEDLQKAAHYLEECIKNKQKRMD